MEENKKVTWRHLKPLQEIEGYEQGTLRSSFLGHVVSVNAYSVTVDKWDYGITEEIPSEGTMFLIKMSDDEIRRKYNEAAGKIIKDIQNRLLRDEIGYYELCNSWLSFDPWQIAQYCRRDKIRIVGHCRDIVPKTSFLSGDTLDVGVCAEYEDGERFWCHFRSENIEIMEELYGKYQERLKDGTSESFNLLAATYDILEERAAAKESRISEQKEKEV